MTFIIVAEPLAVQSSFLARRTVYEISNRDDFECIDVLKIKMMQAVGMD